ncbi:MAG: hypothetical protein WCZ23_10350 [Rhodospirillaceae bacterium]
MFNRFSKALTGFFQPDTTEATKAPATPRVRKVAPPLKKHVMTPQRAELIRNAIKIHRAKKHILADLTDEQRQKLVAMAMSAFLGQANAAIDAKAEKTKAPNGTTEARKAASKKT